MAALSRAARRDDAGDPRPGAGRGAAQRQPLHARPERRGARRRAGGTARQRARRLTPSEIRLDRRGVVALDAGDDLRARGIGVGPALELHPLALLEVLVVLEEVLDAVLGQVVHVVDGTHMVVGRAYPADR